MLHISNSKLLYVAGVMLSQLRCTEYYISNQVYVPQLHLRCTTINYNKDQYIKYLLFNEVYRSTFEIDVLVY